MTGVYLHGWVKDLSSNVFRPTFTTQLQSDEILIRMLLLDINGSNSCEVALFNSFVSVNEIISDIFGEYVRLLVAS